MAITVLNKWNLSDPLPGVTREYVGRPHILGNPFVLGKDGDRDTVIAKYRQWLWSQLQPSGNKAVRLALHSLLQQARLGDVELVCWCAPERCHADVLVSAINWLEQKYALTRE